MNSGLIYNTDLDLTFGNQHVEVLASGTPTLDGKAVKEGHQTLKDGTTLDYNKNKSTLTINGKEYKIEIQNNKDHNGAKHIDYKVKTGDAGVYSDGVMPTGFMGVMFDADNKASSNESKFPSFLEQFRLGK